MVGDRCVCTLFMIVDVKSKSIRFKDLPLHGIKLVREFSTSENMTSFRPKHL